MQPVEIYTSPLGGFWHVAKRLLNEKGFSLAKSSMGFSKTQVEMISLPMGDARCRNLIGVPVGGVHRFLNVGN